jgi:hypothetical protein
VLTVEHGPDAEVVRSGMNVIETIPNADAFRALKATKRAMWAVVDKTRDEVCGKTEKQQRPINGLTFDGLMDRINDMLIHANEKLREMTEATGNFPYSFNEVIMTSDYDEAGIYLRSGRTPVCSVVRAGSKEGVLRDIKAAIWSEVDAIRGSIERRKSLKEEAHELELASKKREQAAAALVAAGLSPDILGPACDPESAKGIVSAAKKAVSAANLKLIREFGVSVNDVFGGIKSAKLVVKGFSGGLVVLADGKPCLVSRFPKIGNNKTAEKTIAFVTADIASLGESRRNYLLSVRKRIDAELRLREISERIHHENGQLLSMSM